MEKILIIEDNEKLRKELEIFLSNNGYEIMVLEDFNHIIQDIFDLQCNLILLDIQLPNTDGQYLLREIRKTSEVPIIMVTSRNNEIDELLSMNYGADDYVTKPFNIQILLAKITAILRRANKVSMDQNRIDCNDFVLNISKSRIEKEETEIDLTKNELKILHYLVQKRGQIVARDEIIEYLWDSESFIDDNTLTVNITRLKNKLDEIHLRDIIETKRGQGYLLR